MNENGKTRTTEPLTCNISFWSIISVSFYIRQKLRFNKANSLSTAMEQFNLNWHTYNDNLRDMMQNLLQSNESSDVTLVCEDRTKFKAHKFVLNACSPVFQSIINDLPQKDPIIYLRGVLSSEMKSILQFMYLGQATFYQDRMNDFLNVAKSFEVKEISKDVEVDDASQDHENEVIEPNNEKQTNVNLSTIKGEMEHMNIKLVSYRNEAGQYPCDKCDKIFTSTSNLFRHIRIAHEGIKFSCDDCLYKATTRQHLLTHIQAVHKGLQFPCDLCDYKAKQKSHLYTHKKNKH